MCTCWECDYIKYNQKSKPLYEICFMFIVLNTMSLLIQKMYNQEDTCFNKEKYSSHFRKDKPEDIMSIWYQLVLNVYLCVLS